MHVRSYNQFIFTYYVFNENYGSNFQFEDSMVTVDL